MRLRRALGWSAVAAGLVVVAFHLGGGWLFASQIDAQALSARERRAALVPTYDIEVVAIDERAVTLRKEGEARLSRVGTFGLVWDGGWGVVGAILETSAAGTVKRSFRHQAGSPLAAGRSVALNARVYEGDPETALGIRFEEVVFPGELGQHPAWLIPGRSDRWFIFVHGNSMSRGDGLRVLPTIARSGWTAFLPTVRGDEGAPEDPGGRLTYGKREWRDLEAAVQYAADHGARSVVIEGMSMGGGITVAFLLESPLAHLVSGVILDSPMLDLEQSVEYQANDERIPVLGLPLPRTLVATAEWLAARRFGVDWGYLDYLDKASLLATPMLLIHGSDDDDIPLAASRELARRRPDLVREFYVAASAGHTEAWNVAHDDYERRVDAFLASVIPPE